MKNINVGLVNGLLYYDYKDLLNNFLDEINISYITSGKTNKKTIDDGKNILVDESCLSLKIFFGHICEIADKCDYIIIIRSPSIRKNEMMCTNFYCLYDLANNLFPNKIIELNIDLNNNIDLEKAFIELGKKLGIAKKKSILAFKKSYKFFILKKDEKYNKQLNLLKNNKKKILLVGHSYNLLDDYIMKNIEDVLDENEIDYLLSNYFIDIKSERYKIISNDIYWSKSIDILNAIMEYKNYVHGIILISAFPCGLDSLVNEMIIRKINIPILNLVIDELNDNGGIVTRLESFIDIIKMKEHVYGYKN